MGFAANILMVWILGHEHSDLNVRSAWLHVLGDTLSSAGVLTSGAVIYFTGWRFADPLAGVFIGLVIVTGGARVVWEAVEIFLDLVPRGYDLEEIAAVVVDTPGVKGVHHLHLRSLAHGRLHFTAHVWVEDQMLSESDSVLREIQGRLASMGIDHVTLQLEAGDLAHKDIFCESCGKGTSGTCGQGGQPAV
jgi:cobalt-zinc-cadmium efflux system protein